jgi:hypothetical protein
MKLGLNDFHGIEVESKWIEKLNDESKLCWNKTRVERFSKNWSWIEVEALLKWFMRFVSAKTRRGKRKGVARFFRLSHDGLQRTATKSFHRHSGDNSKKRPLSLCHYLEIILKCHQIPQYKNTKDHNNISSTSSPFKNAHLTLSWYTLILTSC